jgi:adenylate cyclase
VEAPPLERKLIAILAADVEGYSRLMHEDEERTLATLTAHRRIIDDLIAAGRGEISGSAGDSVLAEFASVVDAVHCAVGIQQALTKANRTLPPGATMMLRIGINVGDVMVKDGSIFGDGVNVAARLEALAEPGGICVTRGVRDQVRDRLNYAFQDLGEHSVKNIARPVRAFRLQFDPDGTTELSPGAPPTSAAATSSGDGPGEANATELAFWKSVQASDDPAEYGAYLARFPDGTFSALAHARIAGATPPGEVSAEDRSVELAFWDSIKGSDSKAMFEAYLEKFPMGEFRPLAEIRIAELAPSGTN